MVIVLPLPVVALSFISLNESGLISISSHTRRQNRRWELLNAANVCFLSDSSSGWMEEAEKLATKLSLPLLTVDDIRRREQSISHVISIQPFNSAGVSDFSVNIQSIDTSLRTKKLSSMKPLMVDFLPGTTSKLGKRIKKDSGQRDGLLKAVFGPSNKEIGQVVFDLTAGFGQDSFIIANTKNVKMVCMVERNPVIAVLLKDALRRLALVSNSGSTEQVRDHARNLAQRLRLVVGDGVEIATDICNHALLGEPDVIYIDPMFPER